MNSNRWVGVLAALTTMAIGSTASAAEQAAPFDPAHTERVIEFPFESGFIPDSGPLRLNLGVTAYQEVGIEMTGDAIYDDGAKTMTLRGMSSGGLFSNEVGAEVSATVSIDVFGFGADFDVGIWDIAEIAQAQFDPYVLADGAMVEVAQEVGPYNLVTEPFSIGPATGTLVLDVRIDAPGVTYTGTSVELVDDVGTEASIKAENEPVGMALGGDPGTMVEVTATQHGAVSSAISLHLLPSVIVDVFGLEYEIGPFDVEVAYPVLEAQSLAFEPETLAYEMPALPEPAPPEDPDEPAGDGGSDGGGSDGGEDPMDDDVDVGGDMDPELPPAAYDELNDDGGCACSAQDTGERGWLGVVFALGLLGLGRRRTA